jgi:hypothetical protein
MQEGYCTPLCVFRTSRASTGGTSLFGLASHWTEFLGLSIKQMHSEAICGEAEAVELTGGETRVVMLTACGIPHVKPRR